MSNILKATRLDFSLVKPYVKVIGFTMLLPIAFAAINRSILTGVSFAMCFIAMTTGYTFSVTEKNSMERLYGILPVKKSDMVMGRYLFVVVLGFIALVVSLITHPIVLRALGETVEPFDIISAAIGGLFLFALYTVFQIPGYYKFGSIKGRVFMYIPVAGFLVTLFFLPNRLFMGILISLMVAISILPIIAIVSLSKKGYVFSIIVSFVYASASFAFVFAMSNVLSPLSAVFRWALPHMTTGPTYGLDDWFLSSPACIGVLIITAIASLSLSIILTKKQEI